MPPTAPQPDGDEQGPERSGSHGRGEDSAGEVGPAARGVLREIDQQLDRIQRDLAGYEHLVAERDRLLAARKALTGAEGAKSGRPRVSQDDVAAYLTEHPGSLPAKIAKDLDVPVTNVSQHLYRGKDSRFERREDGWHLRGQT